jgi:hypothetical protein
MNLLGFILIGLIVLAIVAIVVGSIRRKGRWGLNPSLPNCPNCGTKVPALRTPSNYREALWGGWKCLECGSEMDKWGNDLSSERK